MRCAFREQSATRGGEQNILSCLIFPLREAKVTPCTLNVSYELSGKNKLANENTVNDVLLEDKLVLMRPDYLCLSTTSGQHLLKIGMCDSWQLSTSRHDSLEKIYEKAKQYRKPEKTGAGPQRWLEKDTSRSEVMC